MLSLYGITYPPPARKDCEYHLQMLVAADFFQLNALRSLAEDNFVHAIKTTHFYSARCLDLIPLVFDKPQHITEKARTALAELINERSKRLFNRDNAENLKLLEAYPGLAIRMVKAGLSQNIIRDSTQCLRLLCQYCRQEWIVNGTNRTLDILCKCHKVTCPACGQDDTIAELQLHLDDSAMAAGCKDEDCERCHEDDD